MPDEIKKEDNFAAAPVIEQTPDVDWEARYKESQEQLAKVGAERENYKTVALSKKGKSDDDDELEDKLRRIAREEALATQEGQIVQEQRKIVERALQENKELKVALKNRAQVGTQAQRGGGESTTEVKTDFWTAEQMTYFKKHNIDPEKAKENYLKIKNQ